jgi:DNA-binding NarL/FixJ family response regulator
MVTLKRRKILFVDEQELFCEGLLTQFKFQKGLQVVGVASDCLETIEKTEELKPDILIMDIYIPHRGWIETIRSIRSKFNALIITVLSQHAKYVDELISTGINACISRNVPEDDVLDIIESLKEDSKLVYPIDFGRDSLILNKDKAKGLLTDREMQILTLVSRGLQNKEIAYELSIRLPTVNNHLYNIFKKLDCCNRTEAVFTAFNKNLLII